MSPEDAIIAVVTDARYGAPQPKEISEPLRNAVAILRLMRAILDDPNVRIRTADRMRLIDLL